MGKTVDLYLGSVTILERRLEDDSEKVKTLMLDDKSIDATKAAQITEILQQVSQSVANNKKELEALTVPEPCKDLQGQYVAAFTATETAVTLTTKILAPNADVATKQQLRAQLAEQEKQLAATEEKIREAKTQLAKTYREVQVPEVFTPEEQEAQQKASGTPTP